ncbi:flagellar hook-associated protein FlgK [Anaeromusa acidaminophila]|uniref:flagellar hook-associated protein FlgK n=1 Tax=Anaeromusa acidaminophila TaxID=81464 RepID=UPI00036D4984|nr:flagellar hook-associated protein FlgK [Anaeromusa acidaminophila]
MASTFFGVSIANSGLRSSQAALTTTSNNVANVKTTGYSRQVVTQVAAGAAAVYNGSGIIGGGSEVTAIERERNWRLDQSYWSQNTVQTTWQTKSDTMSQIESVFGEPSDNGFTTMMKNFHDALENLSKASPDPSVRTTVESYGEAFCQYLHDAAATLQAQREGVNQDVKASVDQINSYAKQLADLNQTIAQAKASGSAANELQDQRDLLLDKLSAVTGITVTKTAQNGDESNPIWSVSIGSQMLVNGGSYDTIKCTAGTDNMFTLQWEKAGDVFVPNGGSLGSQLELRDGTGTGGTYQGVPYYQAQLDEFARTFARSFNEGSTTSTTSQKGGHATGYGADGSTGLCFFTSSTNNSTAAFRAIDNIGSDAFDNQYATITAANISVSSDIKDNVAKIAAASANPTTTSGESDNNNAKALADLLQSKNCMGTDKGTPEDAINAIVTTMGTNSAYAKRMATNLSSAVATISTRRSSVSGVSTNEEASNLTMYQQAYESSAKVLNTWDDIYTTTLDLLNGD